MSLFFGKGYWPCEPLNSAHTWGETLLHPAKRDEKTGLKELAQGPRCSRLLAFLLTIESQGKTLEDGLCPQGVDSRASGKSHEHRSDTRW